MKNILLRPLRARFAAPLLALAAAMALPPPASAQQPSVEVEAIRKAFDAWAQGTGGPYDLLADDAVWTITGNSLASRTYPSREAFMTEVIRPFNARMSTGLKPTIHRLYQDGDTVIVFFDASGTARDGQPYNNTYAWFLQMKAGRIIRAHAFYDAIAFNALWTRVQPGA
ncbi:nuclear transport factor 2 family protein [Stenotrophomonas maltophilia]|uniref:nuclear transport factor 2 family protein n=1 Tax=Stenotrophomonas maltophilia TaxID=40324 RepID=UPI0012AF97B9|nr:nuclear transport factor 2 family protein [Stenotrophomonas maltophilia]QGM05621.1 nuclear transport factor 2 family protein [Stenotrophomonas maltophilia]